MTALAAKSVSLALLVPLMLVGTYRPEPARANDTAAIVGGLIVGAAVGAALSKKHKHPKTVYVPAYAPYPPGGYGPAWNQAFSPAPGITCYAAQHACYQVNGAFNPAWTYQVYGQ